MEVMRYGQGLILTGLLYYKLILTPVPEFIIKNNLRTIGSDAKDFIEFVEKH